MDKLRTNVARFRAACATRGISLAPSMTAIQPWILGADEDALTASSRLRAAGFLVPAIRPPTVPEGTSRLRISLSAAHEPAEVDALADALERVSRP